jgi:CRP/FNR family transcriptional regulator, cyclic AMP receptor protein
MQKKHWFCKSINFLSLLDENEKQEIAAASKTYSLKESDLVDFPNTPGRDIFLVAEGSVLFTRNDRAGGNIILAELNQGEVFGELAVRIDTIKLTTAFAAQDSVIYHLDRKFTSRLLQLAETVDFRASHGFFIFKRKFATPARNWFYLGSTAKVVRLILDSATQFGEKHALGTLADIPCDAKLISSLTGSSIDATLLALGFLYGQNLIAFVGEQIIVRDLIGLRYWSH